MTDCTDSTAAACQSCAIAEANPCTPHREAGCLHCEARSLACAAMTWEAPKNSPRTRWHLTADLMRLVWPDDERRQQGRRLVWQWMQRMGGAT